MCIRDSSSIGDPKPDLMSIGAHGFVPSNVLKSQKDSQDESFSLFGGTSMAAPLVSGSAAILMEEMKERMTDESFHNFRQRATDMNTSIDIGLMNNRSFKGGYSMMLAPFFWTMTLC